MKPEVITRMVPMVTTAQVQRFNKMGKETRASKESIMKADRTVPTIPQLNGGLYGTGTGVRAETWLANSLASDPLCKH